MKPYIFLFFTISILSCTPEEDTNISTSDTVAMLTYAQQDLFINVTDQLIENAYSDNFELNIDISDLNELPGFRSHQSINFKNNYKDQYGNIVNGQLIIAIDNNDVKYIIWDDLLYGNVYLNGRKTADDLWRNNENGGTFISDSEIEFAKNYPLYYEKEFMTLKTLDGREFGFNGVFEVSECLEGFCISGYSNISFESNIFAMNIDRELYKSEHCRWFSNGEITGENDISIKFDNSSSSCQEKLTINNTTYSSSSTVTHNFWK